MIALPAIDLSGGSVVQWVGGSPSRERVRRRDPDATADAFRAAGFAWLHLVDLDAALGRGSHAPMIASLLSGATRGAGRPPRQGGALRPQRRGTALQVGGGVRTAARAAELLALGAARVIVGTRAAADPVWLEALACSCPGRIVVAADVRGTRVVTHGWNADAGLALDAFLGRLAPLPLAGVLVTDVDREGSLGGVDLARFRGLAQASAHPLIAAGGIRDLDDVRRLRDAGAAGAVVGMAVYTGGLDPEVLAREFGADDGGLGPLHSDGAGAPGESNVGTAGTRGDGDPDG
ncbi:MAG TPA: HisA/HisF-related TIM barrel protein [Longimicrobiales bacterium]|nr:HisA/HisF-related TIM barrel protein [Longimicrobiales bacterium]